MNRKKSQNLKSIVSGLLSLTMVTSMSAVLPANAEEEIKQSAYPYAVFAADEQGGITLNLDYLTINGNGITNGVYSTTAMYPNINGTISENEFVVDEIVTDDESTTDALDSSKPFDVSRDMIYIHNKLMDSWFSNAQNLADDYTLSEININLDSPVYVKGRLSYEGNLALNSAIGAVSDVTLSGGNLNGNNAVIYSKFGDIKITDSQASMNGLIYAPFGTVTIDCDNFNLNGLIIAQNVVVNSYGANINYSNTWAEFVGTETEKLSWTFDDWKYLADTDKDGLPNLIEKEIGTKPYEVDTDGDLLPDGYEVLTLGTDPLKIDTDENGVSDYDEDFDTDGLSNGQEYEIGTRPFNDDSDGDNLKDGDEVNTYFTDPLEVDTDKDGLNDDDEIYFGTDPNAPDSDDNGIKDGDEKRSQTFIHKVENEDCAVTEVIVSMEATGNLQKTTTVESIMNKDMLCTGVVGLVGEPFSIETTSDYEKATLTYVIDKNKLGDTEFDNLMFLWYDEEKNNFVELETILDEESSTVSITTPHFSKYMLVDKEDWFYAWQTELHSDIDAHDPTGIDTILVIDCSGSMRWNDYEEAGRREAAKTFISTLRSVDNVAILAEDSTPKVLSDFKSATKKDELIKALDGLYSTGGNNFNASLSKCAEMFNSSSHSSHRNIIFMSDGGCRLDDKNLDEVIGANAKIITVYFGSGKSNPTLEHMANYTHGKSYNAVTADELVNIYKTIGTEQYLEFNNSDTDTLYDIFEQSGMRVQNGQVVHTNYKDPDTDKDGLLDSQEIEPVYTYKTIPASITGAKEIVSIQFIMNSNPEENDDSDNDGYSDIDDPEPLVVPNIYGNMYDFLSNEKYYIASTPGTYYEKYFVINENHVGSEIKLTDSTSSDLQKFEFEWCKTGYKIHSAENYGLVLTLDIDDNNEYVIVMNNDLNLQGQLWEVLPFNNQNTNGSYGLVFRSKILKYNNNSSIGKPMYLSYTNNRISITTDRKDNTNLLLKPLGNWKRFGQAYMEHLNWTYQNNYILERAFDNYNYNMKLGLKNTDDEFSNVFVYNDYELVINQYGGNMQNQNGSHSVSDNKDKLKFADVHMGHAACELMATYNGMKLADAISSDDCRTSFFSLAVEFEINNLYITSSGYWGSNPKKIADCLDSYNVRYTTADSIEDVDNELFNNHTVKSSIVSYKFNDRTVDNIMKFLGVYNTPKFALHSYVAVNDGRSSMYPLFTINRGSNHTYTESYNRTSVNDIEKDEGGMNAYYSSNSKYIQDTRSFDVGYILY